MWRFASPKVLSRLYTPREVITVIPCLIGVLRVFLTVILRYSWVIPGLFSPEEAPPWGYTLGW